MPSETLKKPTTAEQIKQQILAEDIAQHKNEKNKQKISNLDILNARKPNQAEKAENQQTEINFGKDTFGIPKEISEKGENATKDYIENQRRMGEQNEKHIDFANTDTPTNRNEMQKPEIVNDESNPKQDNEPEKKQDELQQKYNNLVNFSNVYLESFKKEILSEGSTEKDKPADWIEKIIQGAEKFHKFWKKSVWFRIGVGVTIAGASIFGAGAAGTSSALIGGIAAWRVISNFAGNALTHKAATETIDETRFIRKESISGRKSFANATKESAKVFFQKLFKGKFKEFSEIGKKFKEETQKSFLDEKEINEELEKITEPIKKLEKIEEILAGTYEIARRKGVKVEDIATKELTDFLLKKMEEILPTAIPDMLEFPDSIKEKFRAGEILTNDEQIIVSQKIDNVIDNLSNRLGKISEIAKQFENKQTISRLLRSTFYGAIATGITMWGIPGLLKGIKNLTTHTESPPDNPVFVSSTETSTPTHTPEIAAGAAAAKTEIATNVQPIKAPESAFIPDHSEIVTAANGKEFIKMHDKIYSLITENGKKFVIVPVDLNHDGAGDIGINGITTVKIDYNTGFGKFTDTHGIEHLVHADDKDFTGNMYGMVAREGQMVDMNKDSIYDAQIWQDHTGTWHASHMDSVLAPNNDKINPSEFVFDDKNPTPPDYLKNVEIPKEAQAVFGKKFEFDHFTVTGNTVSEQADNLARKYEIYAHLTDPTNINDGRINEFTKILETHLQNKSLDLSKPASITPNVLKPLYNQATISWEQAGKAGNGFNELSANIGAEKLSIIAKTFLEQYKKEGYELISGENRKNLNSIIIKLLNNNVFEPNQKEIIDDLIKNNNTIFMVKNDGNLVMFDSIAGNISEHRFMSTKPIEELAGFKNRIK